MSNIFVDFDFKDFLNREFYHGRNANKKKINEKSRTKVFQENIIEDFDNELEEEFYGTKKENKRLTRNDKKKGMEEEEFSNTTRRNLSRNAKKKSNPYSYEEENYDYEEEEEAEYEPIEDEPTRKATSVKPNSFSSLIYPLQQRRNDIDPEMHQFLDENDDAELQRAIQASLQSFQN